MLEQSSPSTQALSTAGNSWVILVGAHKGGSGKSTIATNLAAIFADANLRTLLVSTDPQRTAERWVARRRAEAKRRADADEKPLVEFAFMSQQGEGAAEAIRDFLGNYDVTIIDTGGFDSVELRSCLLISHIFLSPAKPSAFDTDTLEELHNTVRQAKMMNPGLVARLFVNQASPNSVAASKNELRSLIADERRPMPEFKVLNTALVNRVSHWDAAGQGLAQFEVTGASKAASELTSLYLDIRGLFEQISTGKEAD